MPAASHRIPIKHALGPVKLARDVMGSLDDGRGCAFQRQERDVGAQHLRLDGGFVHDLPDRLIMTIKIEDELHQIVAVIARARAFPVDDAGERTVIDENIVGVQVEVNEPVGGKPGRIGRSANGLDPVE